MTKPIRWACGVTTIPSRFHTSLPSTLASIEAGGFPRPWLFVDGCFEHELPDLYCKWGATCRFPNVDVFPNWWLGIWELHLRNPEATHIAMFQDDFVMYRNLRQYIERSGMIDNLAYYNLYTYRENDILTQGKKGWVEAYCLKNHATYHGKKQQGGKGAVALVFPKKALHALLSHPIFVTKPYSNRSPKRLVDGAVVEAMNQLGFREYVHSPSLVNHTMNKRAESSIGNSSMPCKSFLGEQFDALNLLR